MSQRLCSNCGKKITLTQAYYGKLSDDTKRYLCRACFQELLGLTNEQMEEIDQETDDE